MAENIKLIDTNNQQGNFTVDDGYFYTFDNEQDNLLVKTDDGNTAFSYPFDTLLGDGATNAVVSTEFDGVYFWTLQNLSSDNASIKRWKIDNYVCKLQQTITLTAGSHNYDCNAFSVEHYHDTFRSNTTSGSSTIPLTTYSGTSMLDFTTTSGDGLTLHLGPNTNGEEEDVTVTGTIGGDATISGTTQYSYVQTDEINFYTYVWLFNNYDGTSGATGALYKLDAYTGTYVTRYASGAYKSIGAATFYSVDSFDIYGDIDTLMYVKGTNILFVNTGAAGATLPYYGSMVLENIQSDETSVIAVQDIATYDQNIYRLQLYEDGLGAWSSGNYSYDLSSFDAFIASISVSAAPALLAANGVSSSTITAIVKDQFLQPVTSRLVYFTVASAGGGSIPGAGANTDSDGKVTKVYSSGTSASEPKITARAEQT